MFHPVNEQRRLHHPDTRMFLYEPGNATSYEVCLTLAPMTEPTAHDLLSVVNFHASMWLPQGCWIHPNYMMEKLRLRYDGDAAALSHMINFIRGIEG